jgi:Transglutaminase elicitor
LVILLQILIFKKSLDVESYISKYFSASEKYDLLLADDSFTLTNQNKMQGEAFSKNDDVEFWMGICHGWAPASLLFQRPQRDVTLLAADGKTKIKFYADDIRGLLSLKYASTPFETVFVGGRCNLEDKVCSFPLPQSF